MIISLIFIAAIALGGMALTYLVADDEPFMWRLAAGSIAGSALFGTVGFVAACVFGFSEVTVAGTLVLTMLPLTLVRPRGIRGRFLHDWAKAKGTFQGTNLKKLRRFAYYAFFFVVFYLFFKQAMFELKDGIYTGGSQNLGDLPFHLGAILGFTDGNNFPPQNPSWAGARFSYPFIADFITACLVKCGADVKDAIFLLDLTWAFSLLIILEKFVVKLTGSKLAGRLAPPLLFFSGGLGYLWFFSDYWSSGKSIFDFLWHLPREYTIGDQFRWGNSMVVLFITQRSLLLGMPLTILVLGYLWKVFATENTEQNAAGERSRRLPFSSSTLLLGLLAGSLVLIHLHSLAVLFVVTAFLFAMRPVMWREFIAFGAGVVVIAVPELVWSMAGTATETSKFIGWHFGWDKGDSNIIWFWIKNTGFVIPVIICGLWVYITRPTPVATTPAAARVEAPTPGSNDLLLFYIPFAFLFIVSNLAKFAPWEWDNIKILIYWFVGSIPLIAFALAWAWEQKAILKYAAAVCFALLVMAGALDVWRSASGQIKIKVFDTDAVEIADQIKKRTAPGALFLNAPTYNSAVVLSGRRSLMRYSGHLSSHGIDYVPRENDVKHIYEGGGVAGILLDKYNIDYVLISPEERTALKANEEFFKKYPVIAESGQYRVYKIK